MAIKKLPYKSLRELIVKNISNEEDYETRKLIDELSVVKQQRYLTKKQLIKICNWKSPRAIQLIKSNSADKIKSTTTKVFGTRSEREKLSLLTELQGVSVPMASAILMLTNPKNYGVIDIRVWQLLYKMKSVNNRPSGIGFNFKHWYRFLMIIRYYAKLYKVSARTIERTFFEAHVKYQKGNLY